MPVSTTEPYGRDEEGLVVDIFDTSVKMSTYLVAFVVCDYKNKTGTTKGRGTKVTFWDSYVGYCGVMVGVWESSVGYCGVVVGVWESSVGYCSVVVGV